MEDFPSIDIVYHIDEIIDICISSGSPFGKLYF